jgi:four helix bundle protein
MPNEKGYKALVVWRESIKLTIEIDRLTSAFPREEIFTYCAQMRRAALSIPSNIAEGYGRCSRAEFKRFCFIALGSAMELETQPIITHELKFNNETAFKAASDQLRSVLCLLTRFIKSIRVLHTPNAKCQTLNAS